MQSLSERDGSPGGHETGSWITLPPLLPARQALALHAAHLDRLAHALGGAKDWFHQCAWPLLLRWEALVSGLPGNPLEGGSRHTTRAMALAGVLGHAASAAEAGWAGVMQESVGLGRASGSTGQCRHPPGHLPPLRLRAAHRAALAQAWRSVTRLAVQDADGLAWLPRRQDCRGWRAAAPSPQRCRAWRPVDTPAPAPPLSGLPGLDSALAALHRRGIWRDDGRCGRWLACPQGWTLLWPLAGRDLMHALATDRPLSHVLGLLAEAGYRPPQLGVMHAVRAGGRIVQVLPVTGRLRQACGLSLRLPAQPGLRLAGQLGDLRRDGAACR